MRLFPCSDLEVCIMGDVPVLVKGSIYVPDSDGICDGKIRYSQLF